ncbi:MAG: hypothetical protein QJR14_06445 [Bacillota bacterium]|nr:hypothetical protein [Bacillota bacterium]
MWQWFQQAFGNLMDWLGRLFGQVGGWLAQLFGSLRDTLVNLFNATFGALVELTTGIIYLFERLGQTLWLLVQVVGAFFRLILGIGQGILATVSSFFGVSPDASAYGLGPFGSAFDQATRAIPGLDTVGWVLAAGVWLSAAVLTVRVVGRRA